MTRRTPAGCGRAGKRHRWRTVLKDSMASALTQPATRRLARRAGVKRISGLIYEEAHKALRSWLGPVVQRAAMCAEHGQRFTITITDMLFALKASGITLYGFAERVRGTRSVLHRLPREGLQAAHARALQRQQRLAAAGQQQQEQAAEQPGPADGGEHEVEEEVAAGQAAEPAGGPSSAEVEKEGQGACAGSSSPAAGSPAPLTPDRALEIQAKLAAFQDSIQGEQEPAVPVARAFQFVSTKLREDGRAPCSPLEFETVLISLEERNALFCYSDNADETRKLVFSA